MHSVELVESFVNRLNEAGFVLSWQREDLRSGNAQWRFTSGVVDVEVGDDRDELYVAVGPIEVDGCGVNVWGEMLGFRVPDYFAYDEEQLNVQLDVVLGHLDKIRMAIEEDDQIVNKMRRVNRLISMRRLKVDENMRRIKE